MRDEFADQQIPFTFHTWSGATNVKNFPNTHQWDGSKPASKQDGETPAQGPEVVLSLFDDCGPRS